MSYRLLAVIGALLCIGEGCVRDEFVSAIYDSCFSVENCVPTAELCEELTVDFAGEEFTNAICTVFCEVEGPISPDCPRSFIGRNGSCYPSNAAGGPNADLICFEPCETTGDCAFGFRCLGALELCANMSPCDIAEGDRICVPGPR